MAELPQIPPLHSKMYTEDIRPPSFQAGSPKNHGRRPGTRGSTVPASSPEIISSLISSLSAISSPAEDFYSNLVPRIPTKTVPPSPSKSGFKPPRDGIILEDWKSDGKSLSDDAASSPIVRTGRSRTSVPPSPTQKRSSLRPLSLSSSGSYMPETSISIGKISIEPRIESSKSSTISPLHSRTNSVRSLTFKESKERMRDLGRRSKSRLNESGQFSPALSMKGSTELSKEDRISTTKVMDRAKSMYVAPSHQYDLNAPTIGSGIAVPTRESSKRHSVQTHKRKKSKSKSIQEEPVAEAAEDNKARTVEKSNRSTERDTRDVTEKIQSIKERREARDRTEIDKNLSIPTRRISLPLTPSTNPPAGLLQPRDLTTVKVLEKENRDPAVDLKPRRTSISRSSTDPLPENIPKKQARPASSTVDSIDEAIGDYLDNPKLSQRIKDPISGRIIAFSEVGDPKGSVVFCCVGMGTTRFLTAFYDELATTLKLRLITPDRPGVGESEPYDNGVGTPLGWPGKARSKLCSHFELTFLTDDIRTICVHLDIKRFSVLAHSAGAVYALATALRMPQHIRGRVHLLAPWIPPSQMVAVGIQKDQVPITTLPYSQRLLRSLPASLFRIANSGLFAMTSSSIASAMPAKSKRHKKRSANETEASKDKTNYKSRRNSQHFVDGLAQDAKPDVMDIASPAGGGESSISKDKDREMEYEYRLIHAIWDAATANANPAVDLLVCLERKQEIGFRYADINKEVVIHHGSKDNRVPVENIEWLGGRMRRCEVRVLEGEGHGLMASAKVMSDVLTEISQEWESWNAIVGRKH